MMRDRPKRSGSVFVGEEHLEGMAGQHHEIETPVQPDRPAVALHPSYALATGPPCGDVEHGGCRVDSNHVTIGLLREERGKQARATAKIEHRRASAGQIPAIVEVRAPSVLDVIELDQLRIAIELVRFHGPAPQPLFQVVPLGPSSRITPLAFKSSRMRSDSLKSRALRAV